MGQAQPALAAFIGVHQRLSIHKQDGTLNDYRLRAGRLDLPLKVA
jgi:hypothetical protein